MRPFEMSRYQLPGEPPPPPSSQADSYSHVPKTHRVMTLADHISVRMTIQRCTLQQKMQCSIYQNHQGFQSVVTNLLLWACLYLMQHIITQDFARNQDLPVSSSAPSSFQSTLPPVSSSGRVKVPSRYSPENQVQTPHHQRPSSRVSPENALDKPRIRYTILYCYKILIINLLHV